MIYHFNRSRFIDVQTPRITRKRTSHRFKYSSLIPRPRPTERISLHQYSPHDVIAIIVIPRHKNAKIRIRKNVQGSI